jgi:hypothetical protein
MATPSLPALRPLGIGELLDQAIRLYRRNFLNFIGIIAVVQIPIGLVQFVFSLLSVQGASRAFAFNPEAAPPASPFTPETLAAQAGTVLVAVLSFLLVQGVATAAMTRAVADNYLGTPTGFVAAYRRIGRAWLPLVGTLLLAGLFAIGLTIWFLIPCAGWLTGLGMLAFYTAVVVPLTAPVVVLERQSGYRALRRGWNLARRRFWALVGFVVLLFLFNLIVVSGPNLLIGAIFQGLFLGGVRAGTANGGLLTAQVIVQSLLTLIASLLYLPLQLIGFTLLYLDLRVRTEGLDLAMLTQDASAADVPEAVLASPAPAAGGQGLVTWPEMGYFLLLTLAFGVVYAVVVGAIVAFFALIGAVGAAVG